jgi:hypothetical protein
LVEGLDFADGFAGSLLENLAHEARTELTARVKVEASIVEDSDALTSCYQNVQLLSASQLVMQPSNGHAAAL